MSMNACQNCDHCIDANSNSAPDCRLKPTHADKVTGRQYYSDVYSERNFWLWPFSKWAKHCGPKALNFRPKPLVIPTFQVNYADRVDKVAEIADLLVERSGFSEEDARNMAEEIIAIWVKPV